MGEGSPLKDLKRMLARTEWIPNDPPPPDGIPGRRRLFRALCAALAGLAASSLAVLVLLATTLL